MLMNAKKTLTIATWTLLVKTQMDPFCAPVYLDLTEMDGTAQVITSLWLWEMLVCVSLFVFILQESWLKARHFSDIDECARNLSCHVNANCTNTIGSHVCTCHTGYTGDGQTCSGDFNKFPSMFRKVLFDRRDNLHRSYFYAYTPSYLKLMTKCWTFLLTSFLFHKT